MKCVNGIIKQAHPLPVPIELKLFVLGLVSIVGLDLIEARTDLVDVDIVQTQTGTYRGNMPWPKHTVSLFTLCQKLNTERRNEPN